MATQSRVFSVILIFVAIGCSVGATTLDQIVKHTSLIQRHPELAFLLDNAATIAVVSGIFAVLFLIMALVYGNFLLIFVGSIPLVVSGVIIGLLLWAERNPVYRACYVHPLHDVSIYVDDKTGVKSPGFIRARTRVRVLYRNDNRQDRWYLIEMSPDVVRFPGYEERRNAWVDAGLVIEESEAACVDLPVSPEKL